MGHSQASVMMKTSTNSSYPGVYDDWSASPVLSSSCGGLSVGIRDCSLRLFGFWFDLRILTLVLGPPWL